MSCHSIKATVLYLFHLSLFALSPELGLIDFWDWWQELCTLATP